MKAILLLLIILFFYKSMKAQEANDSLILHKYNQSFSSLNEILAHNGSFKDAVLLTEEIFSNNSIDINVYKSYLSFLSNLSAGFNHSIIDQYRWRDSMDHKKNLCVFELLTNTLYSVSDSSRVGFAPFRYSFTDPLGKLDWSNMFVTKLLATLQGNCHSLAYLYKILADEVGAKCWLALAPNHIYIKKLQREIRPLQYRTHQRYFPNRCLGNGFRLYINPQKLSSPHA